MSARDHFSVWLYDLHAGEIGYHRADDTIGERHILDMTSDVSLYVRPGRDDLPAIITGLRKLAAAANDMADALAGTDGAA
jgi:hypothetical protein